ncbi:MAG: cobyric acid synthase [Pseudomonadota bacterium]
MTALMVQGTGSDVGKSLIVAGLCRAFKNRGLTVRPFKPQNMSNNAAVTIEDGEIGRAQWLQAAASGVAPSVHMNPVLLKPESETGAQVIVQGNRVATLKARAYFKERAKYLPAILESFEKMQSEADLVLVEGAGSPAEVNLRRNDLANMGFARAVNMPVLLVGDIHRGGVIASLVGTKAVLEPDDAAMIGAFLINNFHGDPSLFEDGLSIISERTGWFSAGIVPHFPDAAKLPAEDALALDRSLRHREGDKAGFRIVVPRLSRLANFDDLDPLRLEEGVEVVFVKTGEPLPGDADLVLIPGSKSTISDLKDFRKAGWNVDLAAHIRRGGHVLGLCGGFQMLGRKIHDPDGIEGPAESVDGLGYLNVETVLTQNKALRTVDGYHLESKSPLSGYEMHLGSTKGPDCAQPFARIDDRDEGAVSPDRHIAGTYLHGVFSGDAFRRAFLKSHGVVAADLGYTRLMDETLDRLAEHLEQNVALDRLLDLARRGV